MADKTPSSPVIVAATGATAAAVGTPKKAAVTKSKNPRVKPAHRKTAEMVSAAIKELKERGGSSLQAIKKYIANTYKVDAEKQATFIKKYLKAAVASGALVETKGKGAAGSFKLAAKVDATKPKAKPAAKPKCPKKAPAAKKPATMKKPATAKKSPTKKVAATAAVGQKKKVSKGPAAKPKKAKTIEAKPATKSPAKKAKPAAAKKLNQPRLNPKKQHPKRLLPRRSELIHYSRTRKIERPFSGPKISLTLK